MTTLTRWWKFNLVGAMGMVVQLVTLALINNLTDGRYLVGSAVAIELALLHNFVWHLHYTWRDRRDQSAIAGQLLRFHLSNGLISLVVSLVLMRILVHEAQLAVIPANIGAILCCSTLNFWLGDLWAFSGVDRDCLTVQPVRSWIKGDGNSSCGAIQQDRN